ncbi:MAG: HdeD family acid-resistance protein [Solirubrobacterales bacterium]
MEAATTSAPDPVKEFTKLWWIPLVTGIAWTIIALIILRFDTTSVTTIGVLAGIVFIGAGVTDLMMSMLVDKWKWAYVALGMALIIIGIVALFSPQDTFVALAAIIGWFLLFKGVFDICIALMDREVDLWWLTLVLGIIEVGLAFWAAGYFGRKVVLLIIFVAAAALARGITQIVLAFQLRELNKQV